jgi:hypothetical protein
MGPGLDRLGAAGVAAIDPCVAAPGELSGWPSPLVPADAVHPAIATTQAMAQRGRRERRGGRRRATSRPPIELTTSLAVHSRHHATRVAGATAKA